MLARVSLTSFSKPVIGWAGLDDDVLRQTRTGLCRGDLGVWELPARCVSGKKVHGVVLPVDAGVGGVFHHANDLMRPILGERGWPESPKRWPIGLRLPKNCFTNSWLTTATGGAFSVSCSVKPRPITTWVPTESKYSGVPFTQDAPLFSIRIALNLYAGSPVVLLHRRVGGEADFDNAGNRVEAVYDGLVERLDLGVLVARRLRIDVSDISIRCIQFHVHVLGLVEALRKQARGNQQHQRERGLQHNQRALQQRCSLGRRARVRAQSFSRLRARCHQRWRKAKEDAREQRKRKSKTDDREAKAKK